MKQSVNLFWFSVIVFSFSSCSFQCEDCFTPPPEIRLKIVDSEGNNLVESGIYAPDSIQLYYIDNGNRKEVGFELPTYYPYYVYTIYTTELTWLSIDKTQDFYLRLNYLDTDTLTVSVKEKHDDCCTYFDLVKFDTNGEQAEYNSVEYLFLLRK